METTLAHWINGESVPVSAESTSRTTLALARIATQEGLPDGVLNVVLGQGSVVGTAIVEHPHGREKGIAGLNHYSQVKSISVRLNPAAGASH